MTKLLLIGLEPPAMVAVQDLQEQSLGFSPIR
jgi:hypothetical protein